MSSKINFSEILKLHYHYHDRRHYHYCYHYHYLLLVLLVFLQRIVPPLYDIIIIIIVLVLQQLTPVPYIHPLNFPCGRELESPEKPTTFGRVDIALFTYEDSCKDCSLQGF